MTQKGGFDNKSVVRALCFFVACGALVPLLVSDAAAIGGIYVGRGYGYGYGRSWGFRRSTAAASSYNPLRGVSRVATLESNYHERQILLYLAARARYDYRIELQRARREMKEYRLRLKQKAKLEKLRERARRAYLARSGYGRAGTSGYLGGSKVHLKTREVTREPGGKASGKKSSIWRYLSRMLLGG